MSQLTFDLLRTANAVRLPLFKNSRGGPSHSTQDGTDWSPAQWLQAVLGELGEFAMVRVAYEAGLMSEEEYREKASKELADVVTYLDILARRAFDKVGNPAELGTSTAQRLMAVVAGLGEFANARKKYDRGDYNEREYYDLKGPILEGALHNLRTLATSDDTVLHDAERKYPSDYVIVGDDLGVDLGEATRLKFNEVSNRVQAPVYISEAGELRTAP